MNVPFIDLQLLTEQLVLAAGPEGSKRYYMWTADGKKDDTHLNVLGSRTVARLAAEALRKTGLPIARHITIPRD